MQIKKKQGILNMKDFSNIWVTHLGFLIVGHNRNACIAAFMKFMKTFPIHSCCSKSFSV